MICINVGIKDMMIYGWLALASHFEAAAMATVSVCLLSPSADSRRLGHNRDISSRPKDQDR